MDIRLTFSSYTLVLHTVATFVTITHVVRVETFQKNPLPAAHCDLSQEAFGLPAL